MLFFVFREVEQLHRPRKTFAVTWFSQKALRAILHLPPDAQNQTEITEHSHERTTWH
jgi:hypothetical protein